MRIEQPDATRPEIVFWSHLKGARAIWQFLAWDTRAAMRGAGASPSRAYRPRPALKIMRGIGDEGASSVQRERGGRR